MISPHNYTYPHLTISVCGCLYLGPSGVGVNELRRQLIELNPNHFQSAVPRMFHFSFILVHVLVKFLSFKRKSRFFASTGTLSSLSYALLSLS